MVKVRRSLGRGEVGEIGEEGEKERVCGLTDDLSPKVWLWV